MNVLRMPRLFAGLTLIAAILSGCATPQPIPDVLQPQSSGLGIQVTLKAPVGIFSNSPSQVYFARLMTGEECFSNQLFAPTMSKATAPIC